jgi:membrane protein implicated in regulation of membrane protease activity
MQTAFHTGRPANRPSLLLFLFVGVAILLTLFYWQHTAQSSRDHNLRMEKSSGKNGKHANAKARESAENQYQKVKPEYEYWDKKPNKTPDEKNLVKKLRKQLERLRLKKDFKGENHSQKRKGH